MAFSVTICLTTPTTDADNFSIYHTSAVAGNLLHSGITKTSLANYVVTGIPDGATELIVKSMNDCPCSVSIELQPVTPTPTPTVTPTATPGVTITPTITPSVTPTKTPTVPLPGCGDTINGTYELMTFANIDYNLDFSERLNGDIITVNYTAYGRPNKFDIYESGAYLTGSTWAGADTSYSGPWTGNPIDTDGTGNFTFTYNSSKTYSLKVLVGAADPNNQVGDSYTVVFNCSTPVTPPTNYAITANFQGRSGSDGNFTILQSSDNITFTSALQFASTDGAFETRSFVGTPGYWYKIVVARTNGAIVPRINIYTQVSLTDFSPGPINNSWCSGPNDSTLQSDVFQLPNPVQSRNSIVFYGDLSSGCL